MCERTSNARNGVTIRVGADRVSTGSEAPVALGVVDISVGDRAGVLGRVGETEVVDTRGVVLEGNSKDGRRQGALHIVKEGLLGSWRHGVDAAERQTQETVIRGVLGELAADLLRRLNSLGWERDTTNGNLIRIDVAAGRATIAITDGPSGTTELLGGGPRGVVGVTSALIGWGFGRENPPWE